LNATIDLQDRNQEFTRWMMLRMLYACRPGAASESVVLQVLRNFDFNCDLHDVRKAFDYMESVGLAAAVRDRVRGWRARITPLGIAVVEYDVKAPLGIGRPRRWRGAKR
jgi:hypothetical protein